MVAVLVIGVLSSIAFYAYSGMMVKGRRKAGATCALTSAQYMEQYYATNLRYDQDQASVANPGLPGSVNCIAEVSKYYTVSLASVSQNGYSIKAVPVGVQASKDSACGTLAVDQAGVKSRTGSAALNTCW
jgi:type IV pilus assembly protein PilE